MALTERKEKILKAVVEDYINTAKAISSAEIHTNHLPALSPATIRNELAALEELGYLSQPHTSAGRIPTAEAYRLYIDKLMPRRKLSQAELELIGSYFGTQITEIKEVLRKTAKVISEITNYTSLAVASDISDAVIESVKIIKLTDLSALVIVVTDNIVLKDSTVSMAENLPDEYFMSAARLITEVFRGRRLAELREPDEAIERACGEFKAFFDTVLDIIAQYSDQLRPDDLMLEGVSKIFEYPEYGTIARAREMIGVLEEKKPLFPALINSGEMSLSINIGREDGGGLSNCAIVTANYVVDGKPIGRAGVIGPVRMDYSKVVSVLDYISQALKGNKTDN